MFYDPVRLRTLARFLAPDPWSGHQLTDYAIEDFVMMPMGSKRALDSKWSLHAVGLQWQQDARYRLLPESLVELWKQGRVPAEKLPSLLHSMEATVEDTDCIPSQSWQRSFGIPLLALLLVCPAVFLFMRVNGEAVPLVIACGTTLLIASATSLVLYVTRISKQSRAKTQMKWALSQLSQSRCNAAANDCRPL